MIFCARAKRGLRRVGGEWPGALLARRTRTMKQCSPGTRARLGAIGVGRVRKLRAVKGSLGHSLWRGVENLPSHPLEYRRMFSVEKTMDDVRRGGGRG